jgi:hypothetical protein
MRSDAWNHCLLEMTRHLVFHTHPATLQIQFGTPAARMAMQGDLA